MSQARIMTEILNRKFSRVERGVAGKPVEEQIAAYEKVIERQCWRDTPLTPAIIKRAEAAIRRLTEGGNDAREG
jgi:hypothetical protein